MISDYRKKYQWAVFFVCLAVFAAAFSLCGSVNVSAALALGDKGEIREGIYAGDMELSGMTREQARNAIETYVASLGEKTIELDVGEGNTVWVKAKDLGLEWLNTQIPDEAVCLGRGGNILGRFKQIKDLERENKVYDIELGVSKDRITSILKEKCSIYDVQPADASMKRENGEFVITEGHDGSRLDIDASVTLIRTYMEKLWDRENDGRVELDVDITKPAHDSSELKVVKDVLGTYTTSFSSSGKGRSANVRNGCSLVSGRVLYPGQQLSVYDCVSPFTEENGYYLAGSYSQGLVVETLGGGICQVSSTLYNAVIRAELQVDQRSNHSMVVSYVDISADAAISGTSKDFKFTNSTAYPIYISGYTTEDKQITFTIYGKDNRNPLRKLSFETEIISQTTPEGDKVMADPSQPVGYSTGQSAHTGYSANYWKIVTENGEEKERVKINSSNYQAVPRTVTFGTAGDATGAMKAAISTQNVDHCRQVASQLVNAANAANIAAAQAAAEAAAREAQD